MIITLTLVYKPCHCSAQFHYACNTTLAFHEELSIDGGETTIMKDMMILFNLLLLLLYQV